MSSGFVMLAMSVSEFFLWVALGLLFWKKRLARRFPAMGAYLALHVASTPILLAELYAQSRPWGHAYFSVYFFSYWTIYIVSAALLFFICLEVFRSALSAFPGLMRIGLALFRWAILISLIVTFFSISFVHFGAHIIPEVADGLMRAVGVLALCLLAFLCLGMNALRLSARDAAFGIALGFGLMSANDFTFASLVSAHVSLTAPLQFAYEALVLAALLIWTVYCAWPEPARKPVVMPASSTIYRWNEIASALGHTGTQVAVQQPANSFFLTDVEKVVEKVLNRNLAGRESEM